MPRAGLSRAAVTVAALDVIDAGGVAGFAGLTLAAVAGRVGVAVPSLYKHVSSLGELRRDVAVASVRELTAAMGSAAIGRAGPDALRAVAGALRAYAREHPGRYVASQVAADPADAAEAELAEAGAEAVAVVGSVLHGFAIEPALAIDGIRMVRSALHGFVMLEIGGGFRLPDDLDRSFDVLVETVSDGLRRRGAGDGPRASV